MLEQWQSPEVNELAIAIAQAQTKLKPAVKDCTNPFFKSKYADLSSVWSALKPFSELGIAITQSPMDSTNGHVVLDTQLTHSSGQWMRSRLTLPVAKDDPQGMGSALTYARRYALGCMTGLVTEEDDDGQAAQQSVKRPAVVAPKKAAAPITGPAQGASEPAALPQQMPPSEAPSNPPYKMKIGRQKGQYVTEMDDENLAWALQYYLDKIQNQPDSKYREEWDEAVIALVGEKDARGQFNEA